MAMSYTTLVAPKGTAGSIMNWVSYTKLDIQTVLDEAQSLLYQLLRTREMRTQWTFGLVAGQAKAPLPPRFLDPIGRIYDLTNVTEYGSVIESNIMAQRSYTQVSGSFGTNPFTTNLGSSIVAVHQVAHSLTQESSVTIAGATAVGGLSLNGTMPVADVIDADNFTMDAYDLNDGTLATTTATGGGAAATFTGNALVTGSPSRWSVFDECVQFDSALDQPMAAKLLYYRSPALLSATNLTNWVTDRYPALMRVACLASAAKYMKDTSEYQKNLTDLTNLVGATAAENDLIYRGATFGTDTPYGR